MIDLSAYCRWRRARVVVGVCLAVLVGVFVAGLFERFAAVGEVVVLLRSRRR